MNNDNEFKDILKLTVDDIQKDMQLYADCCGNCLHKRRAGKYNYYCKILTLTIKDMDIKLFNCPYY